MPVSMLMALVYTILIEGIVATLLGYRKKNEVLAITLINIITNPLLNYILWVCAFFALIEVNVSFIFIMEILVILVEWRLLIFSLKKKSRELFFLSLAMNITSYVLGVFVLSSYY